MQFATSFRLWKGRDKQPDSNPWRPEDAGQCALIFCTQRPITWREVTSRVRLYEKISHTWPLWAICAKESGWKYLSESLWVCKWHEIVSRGRSEKDLSRQTKYDRPWPSMILIMSPIDHTGNIVCQKRLAMSLRHRCRAPRRLFERDRQKLIRA